MGADLINKLKAEGWVQQFTASGARMREAVENYRSLGFEVKTIPVKELELEGCTVCFDGGPDETVMIFTRKKTSANDADDDMFEP
jgi:multimeric flavodoxin WrbA